MGEAGNNGASGIWNENKGLYKTSDGNIEILKPEADSDGSTSTAASKGTMLIAGNSKTVALGPGGMALAPGLPLGLGWFGRDCCHVRIMTTARRSSSVYVDEDLRAH